MMIISFDSEAFDQYNSWAATDKKLFVRLQKLIAATAKSPFDGIGKPEPLKGEYAGYWSRRINAHHRLIYKVLIHIY
jgi:toxin YoeB